MIYSLETLLTGSNGPACNALTLSSLNFELGRQVSNHPDLKMPSTAIASPDDLRSLMVMPEFEGQNKPPALDLLVDALVATCGLIKDVAETIDYDTSGRMFRPYAYILERARTPVSCIESTYEWRAEQTGKVASEQANILGLKNPDEIAKKAIARAKGEQAERKAYAVAEVASHIHAGLITEEASKLIEILLDLDGTAYNGLVLAHNTANNQIAGAKKRLEAGQYTTIDSEVLLFANSKLPKGSGADN